MMRVFRVVRKPASCCTPVIPLQFPDTVLCAITTWSDELSVIPPANNHGQPGPERLSGRGLWLVNQLCDLVQVRSGEHGTTVRVRIDLQR